MVMLLVICHLHCHQFNKFLVVLIAENLLIQKHSTSNIILIITTEIQSKQTHNYSAADEMFINSIGHLIVIMPFDRIDHIPLIHLKYNKKKSLE